MSGLADAGTIRDLVLANRILTNEGVLDAFGHASVRDPADASRFLISRSLSPDLVTEDDLQVLDLDGIRVAGDERPSYVEAAIHAAVYRRRPDVRAVCHNHALSVLPFSVTEVPLRPVFHTASVIGHAVPVWDIAARFGPSDMVVRTREQGDDLAAALGPNPVALMRGHGCVVACADLRFAVFTAVYLERNAQLFLQALSLGNVHTLSDEEIDRAFVTQPPASARAWDSWSRRLPAS